MAVRETVVLEYVGPEQPDFEIVTQLPNGRPFKVVFNKKNGYKVEIPVVLTYFDQFRKSNIVLDQNYALTLLNAFGPKSKQPVLKLIERKKYDELEADKLADFVEEKSEGKPEEKSEAKSEKPSRKGKKSDAEVA